MLARMKFSEGFLADLEARAGRSGGSLQLNDVGHIGKNFGSKLRRIGADERLPRVIRTDRIRDDALARMEGVGAFRPERLGGVAVRDDFGLRGADLECGAIL